jgi:hypothetical protein
VVQIIFKGIRFMKRSFFLLIAFLSVHSLFAQQKENISGATEAIASGRIHGRITDSKTNEAVPFASVAIIKKDSIIAGSFANGNGEFSLGSISPGEFIFKVTFPGFKTYQQSIVIRSQTPEEDLGNIKLEAEEIILKTIEISAEKSASEMNIDRKIFNVDKDLSVRGGTATDVMKNIPSVTLDENGSALLRQNAATIYVDGKLTTLTLDQIPADQIERVEVITNPSAKYEANSTGGIINIVLKINKKSGYNGIVSAGAGTNEHYNAMGMFNFRQKSLGVQLVYNYNHFLNQVNGYSERTNLSGDSINGYYNAYSKSSFGNTMQVGSLNLDYFANARNTLSLSGNVVIGDFNTNDVQTFNSTNNSHDNIFNGSRITAVNTHFGNYTGKVHYRKTFSKKNKELTADVNYSTTDLKSPGTYTTTINSSDTLMVLPANPELQNNMTDNSNQVYTLQIDYINPVNDSTTFEWGIRSSFKSSDQRLDVAAFDYSLNEFVTNPYLTNHYKVDDRVNAAYLNYTTRIKKISLALGIRFESSYYKAILVNKNNSSFLYFYPNDVNNILNALFPGIFLTKKVNDKKEFQFNISRKINRPSYRQMMPLITASDPKNYTLGNPALIPEFITMGELNFNQTLTRGTLFSTLFYRNTQNPLTSYIYASPEDPSKLISTTINGGQSNAFGLDNTFKYSLFKGFETTLNFNLMYVIINSAYDHTDVHNQGFNYTGKLSLMCHLPKNFSLQLSGNYESPKIIPQGTIKENYFADCGISLEVKKFITLTLSVSDIFDTKGRGTEFMMDQYIQNSWNRRESRYIKLTAMFRFGKADASLFKKRQQQQPQQQNDEAGFF